MGSIRSKAAILAIVSIYLLTGIPLLETSAETNSVSAGDFENLAGKSEAVDYSEYITNYETADRPDAEIVISADSFERNEGSASVNDDGSVETGNDSFLEWNFTVEYEGLYNLKIDYYPTVSKGGSIERTLYIDGKVPFKEASYINFSRIYTDGEVQVNSKGDEMTPEQIENPRWLEYILCDSDKFVSGYLSIFLEKGNHSLVIEANKEELRLGDITFCQIDEPLSYEEYLDENGEPTDLNDVDTLRIEAEDALEKSSFTIYPTSDKSSYATYPQDPIRTKLNIISGDKWSGVGQWITWEFNVEQSGYYYIVPRFRQDTYEGAYTSRKIYIDGECPFKEAEFIRFSYSTEWKVEPLSYNGEPLLFYLEEGKHTLKMEAVLGDMASVIKRVQNSLDSLNENYRRILMITGTSPDIYRDYNFKELIPEVLENFKVQSKELKSVIEEINALSDVKGDFTNKINKVIIILDQVGEDPEKISELFSTFKDNLSSMGTWIQDAMSQPVELDSIFIIPQGADYPKAENNFFKNFWFKLKQFVLSFGEDYQSFASEITDQDYEENNVVTVWMTNGREQSQILQKLTEQYFTPETGIKINVQLVAATALLPAVTSGKGPDVGMNSPSSTPIDFAIRGAVVDLTEFEDFDEVAAQFNEAALTPFTFNGSVYALPETMTFLMSFYRTDIFEELGISVPTTWDEFYEVVWILQQKNLDVGFPVNAKASTISNANLYGLELFLYQAGGSLYNSEMTASAMDSDLNIECFEKLCELFTLYKFPVDYDFANRFKSGEMPYGIAEYTMYNQLTIFASEIKGLWQMAPVPGTVNEDGTLNYTSPSSSTGIILLSNSKCKDKAWEFMKWVMSTDIQSRYAREVEGVLGAAAKQATANTEAIESMSWTRDEYDALMSQMKNLTGTPEIPGGYYTARAVDFAFSGVYASGDDPVNSLLNNVTDINDEITRKRKEFGLE